MYRITLTSEQRQDLQRRTRAPGLPASVRDRLEMVRLADAGWNVPRIARHLGRHAQTVRAWVKAFLTGGFPALADPPRAYRPSALTPPILAAVRTLLARSPRTWTAAQLAAWIAIEHGVQLSTSRLRIHLRRAQLSYQRTSRSLQHKQDPAAVRDGRTVLVALEKKGPPD